jgi:outer membrane immunogenic protein
VAAIPFWEPKNPPQIQLPEANMKKVLIVSAILITLDAAMPALAADLPSRRYTKAPAVAAPIYNWTGFYIGGHIGGAFNGDNGFAGSNSNSNGQFLGGVQIGGDYQFAPNWVIGIEGQFSWLGNNNNGVIIPGGFLFTSNQRGLGSVTGRLGYTWGPALLYVKGGYAYSDHSDSLSLNGTSAAFALDSSHHDGFTVGAGLEYMFAQNWSAKVEYQFYDFGKTNFIIPASLFTLGNTRNDEHTVKVGLNYRFNLGGQGLAQY